MVVGWITGACVADAENSIDHWLAESHQQAGVEPTGVCDDATFLRRLTLDLVGRVPTADEMQGFLRNPDRSVAIDRLLASDQHPQFWSQLWTTMLIGRGRQNEIERDALRIWLEKQIIDDVPLNQVAFELISAQGVTSLDGPVNFMVASRDDPVMRISRTFLSVQLDCAQCHDHPFDRWTNEDYVAFKRFFEPTQFREVSGGILVTDVGAGTRDEMPVFLTGRRPQTAAWRRELALMVVQSKPFSRAMVNRTWFWLMGRGIIEPVDGLSRDNPAIAPDLLESLASEFRRDGFHLRTLIRKICQSDAYQRATLSESGSDAVERLTLFAARNPRSMLPIQWLFSTAVILDRPVPSPEELAEQSNRLLGVGRQQGPATDPYLWQPTTQTLIRQLAPDIPPPLADMDQVFMGTLGRRANERERRWIESQRSGDVLYALIHSNEFWTND